MGRRRSTTWRFFHPEELVGRTFLLDRPEDGQKHRAKIVRAIEDHENDVSKEPDKVKFLCTVNDEEYEEIVSYNVLAEHACLNYI